MKKISVVLLVAWLLAGVAILPTVANSGVPPNIEITEKQKREAKLAGDAITIEMAKEEEELQLWEKYFYLDVDHNLNEDSQTFWSRIGTRRGNFDISIGWTQKFNELETELMDKGTASLSMSYWW